MKKFIISIIAVAALVALPIAAMAAGTTSQVSALATVDINAPISLSLNTNLAFGIINRSVTGASTATIAAEDGAIPTVSSGASYNSTSGAHPAIFLIGGEIGKSINIHVPVYTLGSEFELTSGTGALGTVKIYDFTYKEETSGLTISKASEKLYVGATIGISADASGPFSGSFNVDIAYQ